MACLFLPPRKRRSNYGNSGLDKTQPTVVDERRGRSPRDVAGSSVAQSSTDKYVISSAAPVPVILVFKDINGRIVAPIEKRRFDGLTKASHVTSRSHQDHGMADSTCDATRESDGTDVAWCVGTCAKASGRRGVPASVRRRWAAAPASATIHHAACSS